MDFTVCVTSKTSQTERHSMKDNNSVFGLCTSSAKPQLQEITPSDVIQTL